MLSGKDRLRFFGGYADAFAEGIFLWRKGFLRRKGAAVLWRKQKGYHRNEDGFSKTKGIAQAAALFLWRALPARARRCFGENKRGITGTKTVFQRQRGSRRRPPFFMAGVAGEGAAVLWRKRSFLSSRKAFFFGGKAFSGGRERRCFGENKRGITGTKTVFQRQRGSRKRPPFFYGGRCRRGGWRCFGESKVFAFAEGIFLWPSEK